MGISEPTQVQDASIPKVLKGGNVAIQCYTGSGKASSSHFYHHTLAYLLPVLSLALQRAEQEFEALSSRKKAALAGSLQAVVVVPSRELAMQIARVGQALLPPQARGCVQQAIGGANINRQMEAIKQNKPLMVVGTPGRLAELSRSGALQTHPAGILVLDEVDQLLAVQFREDMTRLTEHVGRKCPAGRQTILVSATLTQNAVFSSVQAAQPSQPKQQSASPSAPQWGWDDLKFSAGDTLNPATRSSAGGVGTADAMPLMPPKLEHGWLLVDRRHRVDAVRRVIHALNSHRALVFMNFQQRLNDTKYKLEVHKMAVGTLSGDMGKTERANMLRRFARGDFRALIVSDVAARGLDLPDCDAVINLELPSDAAHYAHRAGRTGRAGRDGVVVSLAEPSETFVMKKLARRLGVPIPELRIQGGVIEPIPSDPSAAAAIAGSGAAVEE
ncbi:P-loop containing nucleoside triphosphate hydrolase protein [Coccomyxa subellipsoidea C-169]|uniref:P-loop containing nucleoside triphosphate hydrolase protein n=1 Tax=Coccomyxa subellipsoidea (strain C-169) TaxID=574566 RepID=I0YU42_COCSC|nr:P-loop containing nucleoside triphosphate hydrolase protein [Coccomyxa subellipsoidea C-169]EIE21911.1 P-loop containing nucleoside triphosphate hydrolase protein [Coccomyxa subellipsoidea C-169]|eukprot:XP_005646455.1 P-loop containing nucleoside triphosphate hydrolase protein [Coccomyxa subellipsoidea C-169]